MIFLLSACSGKDTKQESISPKINIGHTQQSRLENFLKLIYESKDTDSNSFLSVFQQLTTQNGYQNLVASGVIYTSQTCEKTLFCKLKVKEIDIDPIADIENAFNFSVTVLVELSDNTSKTYIQKGQLTVSEQDKKVLIDNFYESLPTLYTQIDGDFTIPSSVTE